MLGSCTSNQAGIDTISTITTTSQSLGLSRGIVKQKRYAGTKRRSLHDSESAVYFVVHVKCRITC